MLTMITKHMNLHFTQKLHMDNKNHFMILTLLYISLSLLLRLQILETRPQHGMFPEGITRVERDLAQVVPFFFHDRAEKPMEIDHHLYEFGSVEYHVQSSSTDPRLHYLSIATPLLSQEVVQSSGLSPYTIQMVKEVCSGVVEIVEPAKQGYQLTLQLHFSKIPQGKDAEMVIMQISSVQAVILSSQLKEMLRNVYSRDTSQGTCKPVKLVYHPREPVYVIRQPQKITAVFPMRFKEHSDVIIATAFFQELMDVGTSKKWARAPPCTWSAIPPPELRGEPIEDLSTNGGMNDEVFAVVFPDISNHHIEGKKLEKTVWSLLNFYAYVKNHVKCTRGFIQRRMQKRLESLVQVLHKGKLLEAGEAKKAKGSRHLRKLISFRKSKTLKQRYGDFKRKMKKIRFRIKIHGFARFRRRWLSIPKFSSSMGYTRLD